VTETEIATVVPRNGKGTTGTETEKEENGGLLNDQKNGTCSSFKESLIALPVSCVILLDNGFADHHRRRHL